MDKDSLPKLEIEGFTNVTKQPRFRWRNSAAELRKRLVPVDKDEKRERLSPSGEEDVDKGYKRLLIKTGVCASIAIIILIISSINTPVARDITSAIDQAVNHEFDIEEDIGRLKFVQNLDEEVQSVFSPTPNAAVVFPVDGNVITSYGEGGSKGVRIASTEVGVDAIAKGTVTAVGMIDDKGFVKVVLDAGETVAFHNVAPSVQVDDIVMPGQPIGEVVGDFVYIEMMDGDEYIDPITYIKQRAAMVLQ